MMVVMKISPDEITGGAGGLLGRIASRTENDSLGLVRKILKGWTLTDDAIGNSGIVIGSASGNTGLFIGAGMTSTRLSASWLKSPSNTKSGPMQNESYLSKSVPFFQHVVLYEL
jgi:hypothetical protein